MARARTKRRAKVVQRKATKLADAYFFKVIEGMGIGTGIAIGTFLATYLVSQIKAKTGIT